MRARQSWLGCGPIGLVILILAACSPRNEIKPTTGEVLPKLAVYAGGQTYWGDESYAVVSSAAIPALYEKYKSALFKDGVAHWDSRFDCNHFASYFVAKTQTDYFISTFQSNTKAQSLAMGTVWFIDGPKSCHAVVVFITEKGPVFVEPQNGSEIKVDPKTIILSVF